MNYNADVKDIKAVVLCKVRSTDWFKARSRVLPFYPIGSKPAQRYLAFMREDAPDNSWTDSVNSSLTGVSFWRHMTAGEIIKEVKDSPEECRQAFERLLRRYWAACKAYLIDIAPSNEWQTYLVDRFKESRSLTIAEIPVWTGAVEGDAFEFPKFLDEDADVSIRILMERMFAVQEIQDLLSETTAGIRESVIKESEEFKIFAFFDELRQDQKIADAMIRFRPREGSRGRKPHQEKTKKSFIKKDLEPPAKRAGITQTGDTLQKYFDKWCKSRLSQS